MIIFDGKPEPGRTPRNVVTPPQDTFREEQNAKALRTGMGMPVPEAATEEAPPFSPSFEVSIGPLTIGEQSDEMSTIGAAFGLGNSVVNGIDYLSRPAFKPDPEFTGEKLLNTIGGVDGAYSEHLDNFATAMSEAEVRSIMSRIDRENQQMEVLSRSGWAGTAAMVAAGVIDPTIFIPVGGWVGKAYGVSKAANVAVRMAEGAALGAGAVGIQEAVLQGAQETRTTYDSMLSIGAGTIVGAILGPLAKGISRADMQRLAESANASPVTRVQEAAALADAEGTGVGAQVSTAGRGDSTTKAAVGGLERRLAFQGPQPRLKVSPFNTARMTVRDLAEDPNYLEENAAGIATTVGGSAETQMKMARGPLGAALQEVDAAYRRYTFGPGGLRVLGMPVPQSVQPAIGTVRATMGASGRLTYSQFKQAVADALWAGDVHSNPEVLAAAKAMRAKVFDPLREEAEKYIDGFKVLVGKDTADPGYLTRMWNHRSIVANQPRFVEILQQHFKGQQAKAIKLAEALTKQAEEKTFGASMLRSGFDEEAEMFRARRDALRQTGKETRAEARKAASDLGAANRKAAKETREADRARVAGYRTLTRDLKRGRPETITPDIVQFIKSKGGIRLTRNDATGRAKFETAFGAEIRDVVDKQRGILRSDGLDPDALLRMASDEGFLSPDADLNDFVAAIDSTLKGNPVYSIIDADTVQAAAMIRDLTRELEQQGVNIDELTPEKLAEIFAPARAGSNDTPAVAKAKADIEAMAERYDTATMKLEDIERLADDLATLAPDLLEKGRAVRSGIREATKEANALNRRIAEIRDFAEMTDAELQDIAEQTTQTILGGAPSRMVLPTDMVAGPRGPLKERMLASLPTQSVIDFVERDIEVISRFYTSSMASDIALAKKFGSVDLSEQVQKITDEAMRAKQAATTEAERVRLDKQMRSDVRDVEAIRDRLRGTYALPTNPDGLASRAARVVRDLNYVRLLGGMTPSSVTDIGRPVAVHGLTRTMKTAWAPLVTKWRSIQLARDELKIAGAALDMILDDRVMALTDIMDNYGRGSKFERGLQAATTKFGLVSLMAPWNAFWKQFSGIIAQTRALQAIETLGSGGTLSRAEVEYLAGGGVDSAMADRIAQQFAAHGKKDGPVWWASTADWTDSQASQSFRALLNREVDRSIITPGQEKPLWMSTGAGKILGQFKTFNFASMQRGTIAGLQQKDMATINGWMMQLALGALVYKIKMDLAGMPTSDDPAVWAVEAFDRSGLAGWLMEVNNIAEKTALRPFTAAGMTGAPVSRYASRNMMGALLGPSMDIVADFMTMGADGSYDRNDLRATRKMIPLQNLFYIRLLINELEKGVGDAMGMPPPKN